MGKAYPVLPLGFLKFWAAPPVLDMVPLADNEGLVISMEVQVGCVRQDSRLAVSGLMFLCVCLDQGK
ncbi:hypothetical protein SLEP1_g35889 [Rubroshorea leprosula]|uniref:Uncharacterized protein n=1 Tax=Rubroshorea leprosula TaxID=152421 RepID=A0AAV5KPX7_9ROSI|nr:hypothetical protein SLEP1_g35889 [Rubroshorea leprosula]